MVPETLAISIDGLLNAPKNAVNALDICFSFTDTLKNFRISFTTYSQFNKKDTLLFYIH